MGTNANINGTMTTRVSVDVELLEQMEAQQRETTELRAQLARCVAALEAMLNVDVVEADKTYGIACKIATRAVRAAREGSY